MPIWEQALEELLLAEDLDKQWLPGMLRRWIDAEMEAQALQEAAPAASSALQQAMGVEPSPRWLEELRSERILRYDQDSFPFERLFCEMFETSDLERLHKAALPERPPACPTLLRAYRLAGVKRPRAWRQKEKWQQRHVQQFRSSGPYRLFLEAYCRFVQDVVLPSVGRGGELLFQCPPTLRCQMPSVAPMGRAHRDSDFGAHHGAEINFWVPVTRVWGSNSLQVESEPGRGDFHSLELGPGELVIFNGSRCLHYTEANRTDSVRVSFDFRVIPKSLVGEWRHTTSAGTTSELAQYEFLSTGEGDLWERCRAWLG